ncbi:MAG: hypothetical protein AAGA60_32705 [Cyanobacteria bacterium P01_E01_bin.42]
MAERIEIFNGQITPGQINLTTPFKDPSFLYMEVFNISGEVEIDIDLNVYLPNNKLRRVPLLGEEQRLIDTFSLWFVPGEIQSSGYDLRLNLNPSDSIDAIVYCVKAGCACEAKLKAIDTKLNIQLASQLLTKVIEIGVPLLTTIANPQLLLPKVAATVIRGVVEIFNPGPEPILIGYDKAPTFTNYDRFIEPGGLLRINEYQGNIFAAANGVKPRVKEFSRE